jgi:hypothetical protein
MKVGTWILASLYLLPSQSFLVRQAWYLVRCIFLYSACKCVRIVTEIQVLEVHIWSTVHCVYEIVVTFWEFILWWIFSVAAVIVDSQSAVFCYWICNFELLGHILHIAITCWGSSSHGHLPVIHNFFHVIPYMGKQFWGLDILIYGYIYMYLKYLCE